MYKIKSIGKIVVNNSVFQIVIDRNYHNAMKYLNEFSHIHIFFVTNLDRNCTMLHRIVQIKDMDSKNGIIEILSADGSLKDAELIDIKPYFPSEDTVGTPIYSKQVKLSPFNIQGTSDSKTYDITSIGEVRNVNGKIYIQLDCMIDVSSTYITVFWWFNKFDSDRFRKATECDPPYENAPRSGIFATRSPVRPNPLAMTVARVLKVDIYNRRIYLNNIEAFDKTPCVGICEYDSSRNSIEKCKVPMWLKHWPKYIDDSHDKDDSQDKDNSQDKNDSPEVTDSPEVAGSSKVDSNCLNIKDSELNTLLHDNNYVASLDEVNISNNEIIPKKGTGIIVCGAKENNLKGIDVLIPYGKITAVVGVSGSGKSSLVNETIYAECRRRMEYLSSNNYNGLQKPMVDEIVGCIPSVVITQEAIKGNSYSTVGTYTDTYDYLRSIYANIAVRHCPKCGNEIIPLSRERIIEFLRLHPEFSICNMNNKKTETYSIENMVDRALEEGEGAFYVEAAESERILLQTKQKCYHCNRIIFNMTPATFSYMDSDCRCSMCNGTGKMSVIDDTKLIEYPNLSLLDGASSFYGKLRSFQKNQNANWMKGQVFALASSMNVDLEVPWCDLPKEYKEMLINGSSREVTFTYSNKKNGRNGEITRPVEGIHSIIERLMDDSKSSSMVSKYLKTDVCSACNGERLALEGRMATINSIRYPSAAKMTFKEISDFCNTLEKQLDIENLQKIKHSLDAMLEIAQVAINLGIGYLNLNRDVNTLSGGERQRLKLLSAFKNHISGVLYIFDEPSKGLHPRDYKRVINFMNELIKDGNTIIMVEHNQDMIKIADYIVEIGPGAGENGGRLVGEGTLSAMLNHKGTQIHKYLGKEENLIDNIVDAPVEKVKYMKFNNLSLHNLKSIDVQIPVNALSCICGVSGSGKSSLMNEILTKASLSSSSEIKNVVMVNQLPIGKTSKSIIATYVGVMDFIRHEFAAVSESISHKWDESYFSFNSVNGQCDNCKGEGRIKVKYADSIFVKCPDCHGKRYKKDVLQVKYRGMTIDEILNLSVSQAIKLWKGENEVYSKLHTLEKVGLGYLRLGQGTSTLSGGEASRLKLAKELDGKAKENTMYLLDEPTTGLHFSDIECLLKLINELIRDGNTVVAIEHNKQFLSQCAWKIELGPEAFENGGRVIYQGKV